MSELEAHTGSELSTDGEPDADGTAAHQPARMGRNSVGTISISDAAVTKLAARAAAEHPDAGAAAARLLGRALPGAGHLGVRGTDLEALPKTQVEVDRTKAFVRLELAIRWPCSISWAKSRFFRYLSSLRLLSLFLLPGSATNGR